MPNRERMIEYKGQEYTLSKLSEITGLSKDTLRKRFKNWGEKDVSIETPLVRNKNIYKKPGKTKKPAKSDLFLQLEQLWRSCEVV